MDGKDVYRCSIILFSLVMLSTLTQFGPLFIWSISAAKFSNILPDFSGILPFILLWAFSFVCGASAFSFLSGRLVMRNNEIVASFLSGAIIFGILCLLSLYFSFFNFLPHISAALALVFLPVRFSRLRFEPSFEKRYLLFLALLAFPIITLPVQHIDALYYHVEITRLILSTGLYPENFGSGIGLGISSNYPPLYSLFNAYLLSGSGFSESLIGISNALILLFILLSLGLFRELDDRSLCIMFVAWLFFITNADTSYPLQFLFFAAAFFFFDEYSRSRDSRAICISAVFFGAISLTTYFGFFLDLFFVLYLAFLLKAPPRIILLFCVICMCIPAPWLLRNFILSGNPVYPFMNQVFHSPLLSEPGFSLTIDHLKTDTLGQNPYARLLGMFFFVPFLLVSLSALLFPGIRKLPPLHLGLMVYGVLLILSLPVFFPRYFIFFAASALILYSKAKGAALHDEGKPDILREDTARISHIIESFALLILLFCALASLLIVPCFFCGGEALLSYALNDFGPIPYYLSQHPEILSVIAFDTPTFFFRSATLVPFDEGYIYQPLLSLDDKDAQICYLKRHSDYIILINNQTERRSPFLTGRIFDSNSSHLEPVHSFGNDSASHTLYRITGCPP